MIALIIKLIFLILMKHHGKAQELLKKTNIRAQEIDYSIDATLNIKEKSIEISQQINFTNPGKERTNILYLQDWVNAYRDTET